MNSRPVFSPRRRRGPGVRPASCAGLTLMETLLASAIVAALIAISFPVFATLRQSGHLAKCLGNLGQLGVGLFAYAADHGGTLPPYTKDDRNWYLYLMNSDPVNIRGEGVVPNTNKGNSPGNLTVYNCPGNPGRIGRWYYPNYAYNRAIGESRLTNIQPPSRVVMLADAGHRSDSNQAATTGPKSIVCYLTDFSGGTFNWERSLNFDVHQQKANILFADGHIESLARAEVAARADDRTLLWSRENGTVNNTTRKNFW